MPTSTLEGIESIRVIRADGNLKVAGHADAQHATIDSSTAPHITRNAGVAELILRANATITVPAGVTVEVDEVAGNLEVADLATPIVVKRVHGNLDAAGIGTITVHETISGKATIKGAASVEGEKVRGSLEVESAKSVTFSHVAGHFDSRNIEGEVAIEKISGTARLASIRGPFIARIVGGHLEVQDAADIEAGVVGGKVRATNLSGAARVGKVGGKLALDGVAGDVAVGFVGGNARLSRIAGALSLEEVGGAVDMTGPYPDKTWTVRSRGRVNVEVDPAASIELDASAGWARVRTYGVDAAGLKWLGKHHVHGPIGPEPANGARTKLVIETRGADVIVASADSRERDFSGRGYRTRAEGVFSFGAPFEDFAEELGGSIPAFCRTAVEAAEKFVSESGGLSSRIVREVTRDAKRSVSEGVREVERAIHEIEESAPREVGEKLAKLGKEISEMVSNAVRGGTREARDKMRERVREAAREMRETIRAAARDIHGSSREERSSATESSSASSAQSKPGATEKLDRETAILEILAAVKDGRLEPDEADDLIKAWMEVRDADARR
jgi:gas vesicle protein